MTDRPASTMDEPPAHLIDRAVVAALEEDFGLAGDITTDATVPAGRLAEGAIRAREAGCIAGLPVARAAFRALDPGLQFTVRMREGEMVAQGAVLAELKGKARALLSAERVALNFLGHLSGIATKTRTFVDAIEGTGARITCTRKTTPGLRALEKYAVRVGGGVNHRFGLFDAVLIKDNHIAAAGGIGAAIERVLAQARHMVKVEVEVDTLEQLDEALTYPVDAILLDNMPPDVLAEAVRRTQKRVILEASGGVTLQTVRAIAETGVDLISVGGLTHSAAALDVGLDFAPLRSGAKDR